MVGVAIFAEALHGIPDVAGPNLAVRAQHLRGDDRRTVAQLVAARGHRQRQGDHLPSPGVAVAHPHMPHVQGRASPTRRYPGAAGLGPAPRGRPVPRTPFPRGRYYADAPAPPKCYLNGGTLARRPLCAAARRRAQPMQSPDLAQYAVVPGYRLRIHSIRRFPRSITADRSIQL